MKREIASAVVALALVGALLSGVLGGLWAFLSLVQTAPFFLMAGIISVLVWGFKSRIEGNREKLLVERTDYRWPRLSIRIWYVPKALGGEALVLMYGGVSTWHTYVGYLCDPSGCGYGPTLTFGNVFSISLFFLGTLVFWIAIRMVGNTRGEIKAWIKGGP